ncbi:MAG: hypothetical protein HPZ91_16705 [Lentisphaeria bacterium]|nr:hypothetical protein [Lentisphaeria bacterium]
MAEPQETEIPNERKLFYGTTTHYGVIDKLKEEDTSTTTSVKNADGRTIEQKIYTKTDSRAFTITVNNESVIPEMGTFVTHENWTGTITKLVKEFDYTAQKFTITVTATRNDSALMRGFPPTPESVETPEQTRPINPR